MIPWIIGGAIVVVVGVVLGVLISDYIYPGWRNWDE